MFTHTAQKYCNIVKIFYCNIVKILRNITAIFQQQNIAATEMSVLKILIRNIEVILQHNIYAILDFVHSGGILAVLLQKHCNNAVTLL